MTSFVEWDGGDAYGVPAEHWRDNYATPGKLLFVVNDDGSLRMVQQWAPGSGLNPITDDNLEAVKAAVLAQLEPVTSTPAEPGAGTVTREEYDALRADLDWVINYSVTGEA